MKTKVLLVLLIVFAFVYWRGTKSILTAKGFDCTYRAVYAVCMTDSGKVKDAPAPKFSDIMKAGIKFK